MTTDAKLFMENPDYVEAARLLVQLHQVIAKGGLESEEADEIRDSMEASYSRLNEVETKRLTILSANLHMLNDAEVFRPVPPEQRTKKWLEPQIDRAIEAGDWDTVLALLRNEPDYLTVSRLAHFSRRRLRPFRTP